MENINTNRIRKNIKCVYLKFYYRFNNKLNLIGYQLKYEALQSRLEILKTEH